MIEEGAVPLFNQRDNGENDAQRQITIYEVGRLPDVESDKGKVQESGRRPSGHSVAEKAAGKIQSEGGENDRKNSVVSSAEIQSFTPEKSNKTTEKQKSKTTEKVDDDDDDWRFEIKRKKRTAKRKNSNSTARKDWYYWVIRIRKSDGLILYYGTLDVLDEDNPERLHKYFRRSKGRRRNG